MWKAIHSFANFHVDRTNVDVSSKFVFGNEFFRDQVDWDAHICILVKRCVEMLTISIVAKRAFDIEISLLNKSFEVMRSAEFF